ncbi:MAG: hypothetical protein L0I24_05980 [Pseudonocardia sp.]|nr:hypothetical protein [Pseudonocardia sp.]
MITLVLMGIALILVLAVVIRALDVMDAPRWRDMAAQRRSRYSLRWSRR